VVFARIAEELESNGFEVNPLVSDTWVKAAPVGLEGAALERTLGEVIEQSSADLTNQCGMKNLRVSARALPLHCLHSA